MSWPTVPLGEVLAHRKEFVLIDDTTEYKRCRVQLHAQGVLLRDVVTGADIKTKRQQVCRAGEFLVAEIDAKHGGFGLVPDVLAGAVVSSHYFLYGVREDKLDRRFLDYYIRTPAFREQVEAQGSTNYAAIRPADVLAYRLPLPPLAEQRRIVGRVDAIAGRLADARRLRAEADYETKAMWESEYRTTTNSWSKQLPLESVCSQIIDYRGRTPPYSPDGVPHLTSSNVKAGRIDWSTTKYVTVQDYDRYMTRGLPQVGDVLFTMEAPLGNACVLPDSRRFSLAQRLLLLRADRTLVSPEFLCLALMSPAVREDISSKATGTTVKGIASKRLKFVQFPVPSLPDQRRIVAHLDAVQAKADALRALQAATAAELDALLPAVLADAFAGRL